MDKTLIITRLKNFYKTNNRLPTYGEMCKLLGYKSKGAVQYVVKKLIADGTIEKDETGKLLPKNLFSIPLYGIIKAGFPMPVEVQVDRNFNFHTLFTQVNDTSFALQISGDSMIEEGIHNGDIVIVTKTEQVRNRDIVAACVYWP